MIDRYSICASASEVSDKFQVDVPEFYTAHFNAAPTQLLPVITSSSPKGVSLFYWGTSPEWSKNKTPGEKIINVRAEDFSERPSLKRSLKKNRCIIPADGFYGWKKIGKKTAIPHRFIASAKELFSIAGLWEEFEDTEGNQIQTFTVVTCVANDLVQSVQDRMPLILSKQSEKIWLEKATSEDELISLLTSQVAIAMNYYPVSPAISDMAIDVPSLIIPTPPADQHGNLTLFD